MYYAVVCNCGGWAKRHTFIDIDSANEYALKHIENECYLKYRGIVIYAVEEILLE